MRVLFPERIIDRHVGGNTTYSRFIERGLIERGVATGRVPAGKNAAVTLFRETLAGRQAGADGDLLHYVADTGPLLRTRRPSVVTVHGVASRWIKTVRTARQEAVWRSRVDRAITSTHAVITVSESSADDVSQVFGVDRASITVIPHGIEVALPQTDEMSRELRQKLPKEFLLYLGNIEPRKNLTSLVRSLEDPEVKALGLPLVIAGKPAWNAGESMRAIEESSSTIRVGFVSDDDRYHLMKTCTAFVFPSLYEGFGFPVLEAMQVGAIVITTRRGSLAEVAGPSFCIEDVTSEGIAAGVVSALSKEAADIEAARLEGRAWANGFSWDASVEAHIDVYRSVMERK